VATYSQRYILSQPVQIDTSSLDQNILYSISNQWLTLFSNELKNFPPRPIGPEQRIKYVKRTLLLNGHPKWMIKNRKKNNRSPEFRSKVNFPCTVDFGETLKRILEKHLMRTIFKPIIKLSTVLSSGKDTVPATNVEASSMKFHVGTANANTLEKRNEA